MRMTVEITDEQHAALLRLAAEQRDEGLSGLIQEAIDMYLRERATHLDRLAGAIAVLGSFSESEARALETSVARLRRRYEKPPPKKKS